MRISKLVRDMCPCPECRNQDTAQRRVNVFKVRSNKGALRDTTIYDANSLIRTQPSIKLGLLMMAMHSKLRVSLFADHRHLYGVY